MNNFRRLLTARRDAAMSNEDKGFTLIELLVVILIIGVLAAIAIPIFLTQQDQARVAGLKADLANAKIAYVSSVVSGTIPPAGAVGIALTGNGYTGSSALTIGANPTATSFCIQGTVASQTWSVNQSGGVTQTGC